MTTKVFKVQVALMDNQKTFTVEAIAIPCTSDDVVDFKTKRYRRTFGFDERRDLS